MSRRQSRVTTSVACLALLPGILSAQGANNGQGDTAALADSITDRPSPAAAVAAVLECARQHGVAAGFAVEGSMGRRLLIWRSHLQWMRRSLTSFVFRCGLARRASVPWWRPRPRAWLAVR
jgi:hypothetical protein